MAQQPALVVLSSLALKCVLEKFKPAFEQALATRLDLRFDATQAILARLAVGIQADLLVLTAEAMEELRKNGQVTQARTLGSSGVGVAVRSGAPKPDIGLVDALERALVSAASVAHSKVGASGIYFAELLERLGIAGRLKKTRRRRERPGRARRRIGRCRDLRAAALRARACPRDRDRGPAAGADPKTHSFLGRHSCERGESEGRLGAHRAASIGRGTRRDDRRRNATGRVTGDGLRDAMAERELMYDGILTYRGRQR